MSKSIENKIQKARLKAFRRDTGLTFFGNLMYRFDLSIESMSKHIEGFVMYDFNNPTKCADGKIHINKDFVGKDDYTYDHLLFLVCHEIFHILRKDGVRRGTRDSNKWNVACDHCVDRDLKKIPSIKPYEDRYNIIPDLDNEIPECSAEEAYKWIENNPNKVKIALVPGEGGGPGTVKVTLPNGQSYFVNSASGGVNQNQQIPLDQRLEIENAIDQFVAQARALYQTVKQKGMGGGGFSEILDKILAVEIPWESLLEKAIKTNTIMKPDERQWRQPNKMYVSLGITLPGVTMSEDTEGVGILIVTADDSGSISSDDLKKFSSVIIQSMKYFQTIKLFVHDDPVQQRKDFDKDNIQAFYSFIKTEGYKGRGGTSHRPVFDEIEELWRERDFKDELSMVISLTDGYSDLHNIYKNYKWLKNNVPLVICCTTDWKHDFDQDNISIIRVK